MVFFEETALSEKDAWESNVDLVDMMGKERVAFLEDDLPAFITEGEPVADLPTFIDTTNVRELYDWKPGESLDEAIARKKAQEG